MSEDITKKEGIIENKEDKTSSDIPTKPVKKGRVSDKFTKVRHIFNQLTIIL